MSDDEPRTFPADDDPLRNDYALFFESFESAATVSGEVLQVGKAEGGMIRADGTCISWEIDAHGNRTEWEDPEHGAVMRAIFGGWATDAVGIPPDPHAPDLTDRDLAAELREARETYGADSPQAQVAFERRKAQVLAEEAAEPEQWFWCSFADGDDGHNLGVAIVKARGTASAAQRAWDLGINPGGEMKPWALGDVRDDAWIATWADRLISREDALAGIPEPEAWG